MDIRVSGHQMDTGDAFRQHVENRMQAIAAKYFERAIRAQVTLSPAPHDSVECDIVAHVMQGLVLKGGSRGATAHLAFDAAAERIEKQLRRYMRRLKDKSGGQTLDILPLDRPLKDSLPLAVTPTDNAEYRVLAPPAPDEEEVLPDDSPLTIAETRVDIPDASVADAVMMLDLRNTTALMFRNSRTGAFNMVYRREDGNIGWVEPRD